MTVTHLDIILSTNDWLKAHRDVSDTMQVVVAEAQTHGRGSGSNTWESEHGKNLNFSILIHPLDIRPTQQFIISMMISNALVRALCEQIDIRQTALTVKWPNDIYWKELKISGTRIDGNIKSGKMSDMVIGTGININQSEFNGTAPNPVSLHQATGLTYDRNEILFNIISRFEHYLSIAKAEWTTRKECKAIHEEYHKHLFRKEGIHRYEDANGQFDAELLEVLPNGIMRLKRTDGTISEYEFKEVKYLL